MAGRCQAAVALSIAGSPLLPRPAAETPIVASAQAAGDSHQTEQRPKSHHRKDVPHGEKGDDTPKGRSFVHRRFPIEGLWNVQGYPIPGDEATIKAREPNAPAMSIVDFSSGKLYNSASGTQ